MSVTLLIILFTAITSVIAFSNAELMEKLKFNAYSIKHNRQWYRFVSHGLVHADWLHLLINMLVLYSFGNNIVEPLFRQLFAELGIFYYLFLYITAIAIASLRSYERYKNNVYYNAVGASGAVSAILFSSIILYPTGKIMLFLIPIPIPAPIFGILYLIYSAYMAKKSKDNIGHDAHFWGAVYGVVLTILYKPALFFYFIHQIKMMF